MDRPIVLCGLGRMGTRVLEHLRTAGYSVVVIDTICQPDDARLLGARLVRGDCRRREILQQAGACEARGVLILTNDDLLNISTALMVRSMNREVRIVLRMFNQNLLGRLGKAVHNVFALSTSLLTAPILAMTALTGQALGTYRLDDTPTGLRQMLEVTVGPQSPLKDRPIASICTSRNVVAVAHLTADGDERVLNEVALDAKLAPGDHLVVHGEPQHLAPLLAVSEEREDAELRWAGWFRRVGRVLWRTLAEMDLAVLVCTLIVFTVVITGTVVLHFGLEHHGVAKSLLRTVSIMATAGELRDEEFEEQQSIRIFVSFLRIAGAVLMAAFTAIVTNYLLRARLGGALEARRIPESGHIIVCGLSTVGFRVIEELTRQGERVVVIEQDSDNRFVPTVRRLGAAVMIGDASVIEVLRQANAATARAVVPATNNDMTNLEVSLLVREMNPEQRVVLLLNDPQFAQMLREAAGISLAVSVPALAAPAFLAGLFGDRVISVFLLRARLFAVLDLVIGEQDPFVGHSLKAVAIDYHLLPLAVYRQDKGQTLSSRLGAGDRVISLIALTDLERLLRRQPSSAAFAVDVIAYSKPTRGWLAGLLRATANISAEEAETAVDVLPLRLATGLTRGQAEDLLGQLQRERVTARVCPVE